MKEFFKSKWKNFLLQGLIYAVLMAGFNLLVGEDFIFIKFFLHLILFGVLMGIISYYSLKNKGK